MKQLILVLSHALVGIVGFALGIYVLPILVEPVGPSPDDLAAQAKSAVYTAQFKRSLKGSDFLHWGEGVVHVGARSIALEGRLGPGPDYKLYLSPEYVETNADFARMKTRMVRVGDVRAFHNFLVPLPGSVDIGHFNTVVVWCETFHQFISSAKYR
jgi:hypothetical protein